MKSLRPFAAAFALSLSLTAPAFADTTYTVNDTIGAGGVTGTIVTDGTIGTISSSNIVSFNLLLNDGISTFDLTNANGSFYTGSNTTATAGLLEFDFNGDGQFMNFFGFVCQAEWSFETTGSGTGCNGTVGNETGVSAGGGLATASESGEYVFATASTSTTPEPGSLYLLGTGLLGVVGAVRRRLV